MDVMMKDFKRMDKDEAMDLLKQVLNAPENYLEDEKLKPIALKLMPAEKEAGGAAVSLNASGIAFSIYGQEHIEDGAMHQMYTAAKLPIAVAGALMPDAHKGYGLPIGGVLATHNAVIPYGCLLYTSPSPRD